MKQELADLLNITEEEYWDLEEAKDMEQWLIKQTKEAL